MIRGAVIMPLLAVVAGLSIPAQAATRYRHVTVRAAAQICQGVRPDRRYPIAVVGFFRSGPENHGPDRVGGALFDSDAVPKDAALHIGRYHGIPFGIAVGWRFAGSIDGITRSHARVAVQGVLFCSPGSAPLLRPNVIAVRTPSRTR